jgi:hypothetical protein
VTCNELKRWLKQRGWVFADHGKKEVPTGLLNAIKKDLGLK